MCPRSSMNSAVDGGWCLNALQWGRGYSDQMRRLAMLVLTAVLLVGCGSVGTQGLAGARQSASPPDDRTSTDAAASAAASSAAPVNGDAPFGTVPAVGGGQIDGGELAGKDLALWFWAPW